MKYNNFKFHAFRKVRFSFAACICNIFYYYIIFQVQYDNSAEGKPHFKRLP